MVLDGGPALIHGDQAGIYTRICVKQLTLATISDLHYLQLPIESKKIIPTLLTLY